MAGFVRSKRVTDPLHDRVKARIVGRDSLHVRSATGSDAGEDLPCLSDLVHSFLEDPSGARPPEVESGSDDDDECSPFDPTEAVASLLHPAANADRYRALLLTQVSKAVGSLSRLRSNKAALRRNVVALLRDLGHNAAVCSTKWDGSGGLTSGNYEFIDVIRSDKRYVVDLDFAGEFEIARPTDQYKILLQTLPRVFVGQSEDLKKIVRLICESAKRSLKSRELHLPPWRKNRYMQNKWFGPCRRTATPSPPLPSPAPSFSVKCRSVGFDAVSKGRFFVPTR